MYTVIDIEEFMNSDACKLHFLSPNVVGLIVDARIDGRTVKVEISRPWHGIPSEWRVIQ